MYFPDRGYWYWYWYWYLRLKYWYLYLRHGCWYWYWYLRLKYWYWHAPYATCMATPLHSTQNSVLAW